MNPKYQKVLSDIEKAEKKKSEIEGQLKELYDKKTELENLEIINTVRSMVMDKDQIMAFLSSMKGGTKPAENTNAPAQPPLHLSRIRMRKPMLPPLNPKRNPTSA